MAPMARTKAPSELAVYTMPAAEEGLAAGALVGLVDEAWDEVLLSPAEGTGEVDRVPLVVVALVGAGSEVTVPGSVGDAVTFVALPCAETATTAAAARRAVVKRIVCCFGWWFFWLWRFRKRLWWWWWW